MNKITAYVTGSIAELRAVRWPTKAELYRLTLLVLGISVATAALVGGLDFLFQYGLTQFLKLKG